MRSLFDARGRDEEEKVFLFQGEFSGYAPERLRGTILKQEEHYATLKLIGVDLSPIVTDKRGTRIAMDMEVYFETRVPGKFNEPVILGKGEAYYFPHLTTPLQEVSYGNFTALLRSLAIQNAITCSFKKRYNV